MNDRRRRDSVGRRMSVHRPNARLNYSAGVRKRPGRMSSCGDRNSSSCQGRKSRTVPSETNWPGSGRKTKTGSERSRSGGSKRKGRSCSVRRRRSGDARPTSNSAASNSSRRE